MKPIVIGLTGGIGSGKTYVGRVWNRLGAKLISADKIAHQVLLKPAVKKALLKLYGTAIIDGKSKRINRRKLAKTVFNSPSVLAGPRAINKLTHPYIRKEIERQLQKINQSSVSGRRTFVVIDAPLLLETGLDKLVDYVVFVHTTRKIRLKRVVNQRRWDAGEIRRREKYQLPLDKKRLRSDFTINNNSRVLTTTYIKRIHSQITGFSNL
ncbi:MAG: dephospho-CoA kinase [Planctomycetota bacterium]|nr:dephospho-CoA kinase [Planctomycetota bacterium]MDI6787983.1 dephospho-CoA kinase [Planctomycetota bacterium]